MDRMKTFLTYALLIIAFFVVSVLLENGLLLAMYSKIDGELNGYYEQNTGKMSFENISAKACNVNGYINFDLINTTGAIVDKAYLKVELYNQVDLLSDTEYVEIRNMAQGENKNYNLKFKANNIEHFKVSIIKELPDKTNIINVLGWEIDLTNVFGLGIDLSNVTIFGTKLTDIFNWSNIKSTGYNFWSWFVHFVTNIPWWGYFGGWLFCVGLL